MHFTPRNRLPHRPIWRRAWLALAALLALLLVLGSGGRALAGTAQMPAGDDHALAVVRAGGATLYASAGTALEELAPGTALTARGRTADSRWAYVETVDGVDGWVATDRVLLFGLDYLPVTGEFSGPPEAPTASPSSGQASAVNAAPTLEARVASGRSRLNVRRGPGTGHALIGKVAAGATVTAIGRNAAGDWVQIEQPALAGGFGWVSARYLELAGPGDTLPLADSISAAPALAQAPARGSGLSGRVAFQEGSGRTIYLVDLARVRTTDLAQGADPALSPDGGEVAFWRSEDGQHHLLVVATDGGPERRILSRGEMIRSPSWSPDGQRIVFSRVTGQQRCRDAGFGICLPDVFPYNTIYPLRLIDQWGLSSVDRDGGDFQDLAAQRNALAPYWGEPGIIYSGTDGVQLTAGGDNRSLLPDFRFQDPASQPGGQRIVFQSLEKDHWEIFTAGLDGSNVTALTRPATVLDAAMPHNVAPTWSPDGRSILFLSNRSGDWSFWVMDADGRNQRRLPIALPVTYQFQMEQVASWEG